MWGTHFMNAKIYLIVYYSIAGVIISLFTAMMTYYIIDVPIGEKMMFKIFLTIVATLPIIGILSYLIGSYLSRRLFAIRTSLNKISEDKFLEEKYEESITDINEIHDSIHELSKRLEASIAKLKESNEQLNNMILSLSHDIRTPLTILEGYLEEYEDNLISKEQHPKVIGILKKETAYMKELSTEVIHYIHSLGSEPKQERVLLKAFLHEQINPLLRVPKGVVLKCELDETFSLTFDKMALKNILINLLHNATKHTSKGRIFIKVEEDNIFIEDTGIGIDSNLKENIFEPFYCVDESRNRKNGGFGLGLSIARNLAKSNGYELFLDTRYEGGCRFGLRKYQE